MLPWLASFLAQNGDVDGALRLLTFQTTRVGGAMMTALFIALLIGRPIIGWLRASQKQGQPIREDGPAGAFVDQKRHANHGRRNDFVVSSAQHPALG